MLNGRPCELQAPGTPASALAELGLEPAARGVAVAVDGEVVPRAEWELAAARRGRAGRGADRDAGRMI